MLKLPVGTAFDAILIEKSGNYISLLIEGKNAKKIFENESGAHQYHRVPPTENRGRIHTSVVKVAVTQIRELQNVVINDRDISIVTTKGSGPGGQNRNKIESAVVMTHKPSGIVVRSCSERSQYQNKMMAYEILQSKLDYQNKKEFYDKISLEKRNQMGTGQRAEKVRTYMVKYNVGVDHRTNEKFNLKDWMKGKWKV